MAREVTRKQAEAVYAVVLERFALYLEGLAPDSLDYPKLVRDWEPWWGDSVVPWAILWESGPFEWAYRFTMGGFDEEMAVGVSEFVGAERTREMARAGEFVEQPAKVPDGVYIECGTSFILCLYTAS